MFRRYLSTLLLILAFVILVGGVLLTVYRIKRTQDGRSLQSAFAHLPTGITRADAERYLGPPDAIHQTKGVLVNSVMFLAATNSKAKDYGKVRSYEQRVWRRGDVSASLFIDDSGRVAGRVASD